MRNNEEKMKELKETHMSGMITIENKKETISNDDVIFGNIGIQISRDGRIWVCINGISFLRFKPLGKQQMEGLKND